MQTISFYGLQYTIKQTYSMGEGWKTWGYEARNPQTKQPIFFKTEQEAKAFSQEMRSQNFI
jgi:hypothetical protein